MTPGAFAAALDALRAELGAPTETHPGVASWRVPGSTSDGVSLIALDSAVCVLATERTSPRLALHLTVGGRATRHGPAVTVNDAARAAGEWMRSQEVGRG